MNAFIYHELTSTTSPDRLEFCVERKMGWGIVVLYPLICLMLMAICGSVALMQDYPPEWSTGIAIGAGINLIAFPIIVLLGRVNRFTVLRVSSEYLTAKGRGVGPSPWSSGIQNIPLAQIQWLGFMGNAGLYASQNVAQNICVLPKIDAGEVNSVLTAMVRRFPVLAGKVAGAQPAGSIAVSSPVANATVSPGPATAPRFNIPVPVPSVPSSGPVQEQPMPASSAITTLPGKYPVTLEEEAGELRFRAMTNPLKMWMQNHAHAFVIFFFLLVPVFLFFRYWTVTLPIALVLSASSFLYCPKDRQCSGSCTLSVNSQRMMAAGDGLKHNWMGNPVLPGKIVILFDELGYFGYGMGDENTSSGFWVKTKRFYQCLLACDRQQATAISVAILRKFPALAAKCKHDI